MQSKSAKQCLQTVSDPYRDYTPQMKIAGVANGSRRSQQSNIVIGHSITHYIGFLRQAMDVDTFYSHWERPQCQIQGCRGYGYPWIYPWIYRCVDIRLRQYPWIFMDNYRYFYVTALELATSQSHNKTKQNRLFVGQLVLVLTLSNTRNISTKY